MVKSDTYNAEINFREEKIFKYVQVALPKKENLNTFFTFI